MESYTIIDTMSDMLPARPSVAPNWIFFQSILVLEKKPLKMQILSGHDWLLFLSFSMVEPSWAAAWEMCWQGEMRSSPESAFWHPFLPKFFMPEILRPKDAEGKLFLYIQKVGPWQWLTFKFEAGEDEKIWVLGFCWVMHRVSFALSVGSLCKGCGRCTTSCYDVLAKNCSTKNPAKQRTWNVFTLSTMDPKQAYIGSTGSGLQQYSLVNPAAGRD